MQSMQMVFVGGGIEAKARMAAHDDTNSHGKRTNGSSEFYGAGGNVEKPDWADGLKQLYDSVVEEPLPDSFRDLLDKLDDADSPASSQEGEGS